MPPRDLRPWARHRKDVPLPEAMPFMPIAWIRTLRRHWPEYLIEAGGIALFLISALCFTALLEHPMSPAHQALPDPLSRRFLMGLAMAGTAMALIYSPWGKQSGAHFNPAVTLTFFRLGRVAPLDAALYGFSQLTGAVAGVTVAGLLLSPFLDHPTVRFAITVPGPSGELVAFGAELAISTVLMLVVLTVSNAPPRIARFTGVCVGFLVASYITLEAPLSGMSMNPARTLGSASGARYFEALWIYFSAPPLGMLLAAELYGRLRGLHTVRCAKLHHQNDKRCIFRCGYREAPGGAPVRSASAPAAQERRGCPLGGG